MYLIVLREESHILRKFDVEFGVNSNNHRALSAHRYNMIFGKSDLIMYRLLFTLVLTNVSTNVNNTTNRYMT